MANICDRNSDDGNSDGVHNSPLPQRCPGGTRWLHYAGTRRHMTSGKIVAVENSGGLHDPSHEWA